MLIVYALVPALAVGRDHDPYFEFVLTDDKPVRQGLKNAVTARGYTDAITVCGLSDIIGDDAGSSMRLI
jgi:hypothetical protein